MPPASRNQRVPTAGEMPASAAASSLDTPRAIAAQNRWRCSRRATIGRPGERIGARSARSARRFLLAAIATPPLRVEFATLEWVAWYNGSRLLEPLGYVPPAEFEKAYHDRQAAPVGIAVLT